MSTNFNFSIRATRPKLAIMNGTFAYVPLTSGAAEYHANGVFYYRHADWLGSARLVSSTSRTMYSDTAYAPFGEPYAQGGVPDWSFTGMNQDTVYSAASGLYDFPAREYSAQGRWISPDPAGLAAVDPSNPQSWNRYAYALNNPLANIDPTGLYCVYLNDAGDGVESIDDNGSSGGCGGSGGYWIAGEYGGGSQVSVNSDLGLVSGYGYLDGSWQYSVAGAQGSNAWGAWTQTVGGPPSDLSGGNTSGDRLSTLLHQDPRLRACIGQANQLFNTQTQNAGVNTNVSDQTRNFDLKTAFGLNNGMGEFTTTAGAAITIAKSLKNPTAGVLGLLTTPALRSIYAFNQTLSPTQYFKDVRQANADYNLQVAACHQAYGN